MEARKRTVYCEVSFSLLIERRRLDDRNGSDAVFSALLARFLGIVVSPGDTFGQVAATPRWLGMLELSTALMVGCIAGFLATEVGQEAWLEEAAGARLFGGEVSDARYQAMERMQPYLAYIGSAQVLIAMPLITLVVAGLLFAVFSVLGGDASFKQLFAVTVHAGVIACLQQIFALSLNFLSGSLVSPTSLAIFFPMLEESGFPFRLLKTMDFFIAWWVMVLAIGLAVLYRRRTWPIALSLFDVYAAIALLIAAFRRGS